MRSILAIAATVVLASVPVFGAEPSITYTLQLGGNNGGSTWTTGMPPVFDTTGVVTAPTVYPATSPAAMRALTWSVRVAVSGDGPDGTPVSGAANLAWDLKLKDSAGNLVSFPAGLGSATRSGFYSTIQNGGSRGYETEVVQAAAFPWVFDVNYNGMVPYGRIWDTVEDNGPHMAQFTYPSTFGFPAGSTAESGTLMGMSAGYASYDLNDFHERGGVGLTAASGSSCYQDIGNRPIAEGQINIEGLPNGTYTLELVPAAGNTVLWIPAGLGDCVIGSAGEFALPVAPEKVQGSEIQFNTGFVDIPPPSLWCVTAVKTHSGPKFPPPGTFTQEFAKQLSLSAGTVSVECRDNTKPTKLVFTYDRVIAPTSTITATATNAVLSGDNGTPQISGRTVTITLASMTNKKCVSVTIAGACDAASPGDPWAIAPTKTIKFKMVKGDVTGNGGVQDGKCDAQDVTLLRARTAGPNVNSTNFWFDLDQNGSIGSSDVTAALANPFVNVPPLACTN